MTTKMTRLTIAAFLSTAVCLTPFAAAQAQTTVAPSSVSTPQDTPEKPVVHHKTTKSQRAAHKAARKENRAEHSAELGTLEKNGYNPSGNNKNYPANLQDAQKKAAGQ